MFFRAGAHAFPVRSVYKESIVKNSGITAALSLVLCMCLFCGAAFAHSALCSCADNGDGTVTCEGGFSDGSSAAGVKVFVRNGSDRTLVRGAMNEDSEFSFEKPTGYYMVIMDAGPGHQVEISGDDITE